MQFDENRKAKVMIVDDHAIVRQGMAMLIDREPDMTIVAQAAASSSAMPIETATAAIWASRSCAGVSGSASTAPSRPARSDDLAGANGFAALGAATRLAGLAAVRPAGLGADRSAAGRPASER